MKGRYKISLALALAFCSMGALKAQQPDGLSKGSLQEQFNYLVNESSRYQTYKVVPNTWLNTFWANVQDTLRAQQGALKENEVLINVQKKNIADFEGKKVELSEEIETLRTQKNRLSVLGIPMNKSVYHVLVWTIIAVLAVGLVFFLGRFRYANTITKNMRQDKEELQVKVDQLRKRMLEKEQELRRQLQDEINKRLG
jgi:chaperonin cofactor prefoldin